MNFILFVYFPSFERTDLLIIFCLPVFLFCFWDCTYIFLVDFLGRWIKIR